MTRFHAGARRAAAGLLAAGLLAAACGGDDDSGTSAAPDPDGGGGEQPVDGGTLTYGWVTETRHLFPADSATGGIAAIGIPERMAIYDALLVLDDDGELDYHLAESLTTTDDGATWTLALRPGLEFSDGTPFDAEAVKFNWDDISRPGSGSSAAAPYMQKIASTTVVDATTLEIGLAAPNPLFPNDLAQSALIFIGSPTAMEEEGEGFGEAPVGAGPYMLEEWVRGDHMTLVRNPGYHGETHVDEIVIRPITDEQQRFNTLSSGGVDAMYTLNTGTSTRAEEAGMTVVSPPLSGGTTILFNCTRPPFDDVRARQALAAVIDGKELNDALYDGKGEAASTLFHPGSRYYADVPNPEPDEAQAQELFDELAAEGAPVEFTLTSAAAITQDQSDWVQARLADFDNVDATVDVLDGPQAAATIQGGDFQAIHVSIPKFVDPYPSLINVVASDGPLNFGSCADPDMDAAIDEVVASGGEPAAYERVAEVYAETLPFLITLRVTSANAYDASRVGGLEIFSDGLIDWTSVWMRG